MITITTSSSSSVNPRILGVPVNCCSHPMLCDTPFRIFTITVRAHFLARRWGNTVEAQIFAVTGLGPAQGLRTAARSQNHYVEAADCRFRKAAVYDSRHRV